MVWVPSNAASRQPLQVLVALHGMGGDGQSFAAPLISAAERNGWVLVAPTFGYGDWHDPEQVRQDDTYFLPQLKGLLDGLPARVGLQLRPRAMLYGFSRGGQLAHRFASFYPQSTLGVASFSCGTFTLPYSRTMPNGQNLSLAFPFGMADLDRYTGRAFDLDALRNVDFLIGVGAKDNQSGDLPHQWDPYLGTNRVDRAFSYAQALDALGIHERLVIFPDSIHSETDEMRARAVEFLAGLTS
jgi:pimeloyl-ACP methyl ester carboxylesterase